MLRAGTFLPKAKDKGPGFKREKNWGFVEEGGDLMIYYALLPCTVVLQFDMGQPDGVVMRARTCYDAQAAAIQEQTGVSHVYYSQSTSRQDCRHGPSRHSLAVALHPQAWTS